MKKKVERSSGNVFADLGLPEAEGLNIKADLVGKIADISSSLKLTQGQLGRVLGIRQPKVSRLLCGYLDDFSEGQLLQYLNRLGSSVEMIVKKPRRGTVGRTYVRAA